MKGTHTAITILVGMTMFAAGFLLRAAWDDSLSESVQTGSRTSQTAQGSPSSSRSYLIAQESMASSDSSSEQEDTLTADMIQVRIDDGEVQWYDGTLWHSVASVEELSGEDRFYLALEPFLTFSEELRQEKEGEQTVSWQEGTFMAEDSGIFVGKKETPKPKTTPKSSSDPTPAPQDSTGTSAEGTQSSTPAATNPTPSAPASTPAPSTPDPTPTPEPTPAPSTSGEGEDINAADADWTGLVL